MGLQHSELYLRLTLLPWPKLQRGRGRGRRRKPAFSILDALFLCFLFLYFPASLNLRTPINKQRSECSNNSTERSVKFAFCLFALFLLLRDKVVFACAVPLVSPECNGRTKEERDLIKLSPFLALSLSGIRRLSMSVTLNVCFRGGRQTS